jgi:hypothetical protein
MSINHYTLGTFEYLHKEKIIEVQTKGFTDVRTIKEEKELIQFAYTREGIPLRYIRWGGVFRVLPA